MGRLAKVYLFVSAIIGSLVLAIMVILHVRSLFGNTFSVFHVFPVVVFSSLPLLGLAKDRNIWRNEMRALPTWVRTLVVALFVYYFIDFALILLTSDVTQPFGMSVLLSSFSIVFLGGALCVPFALLKPNYVSAEELNKRVIRSLVFLAAGVLIATLSHFHLLPTRHSSESVFKTTSQDLNA
jgi:hypothetical protein